MSLHSTEWSADADLRGKRVAVVGAGATAVQIVDGIFENVAHLTHFQRQPHWILPNPFSTGASCRSRNSGCCRTCRSMRSGRGPRPTGSSRTGPTVRFVSTASG
ncbi:hypothetical protein ACU686_16485 [Yinghuangia aomiensis]